MTETTAKTRVLVVEDDPRLLSAIQEILTDEGFAVEVAGDGTVALPKITSFTPDVIVLDCRLPIMCGADVVAWIEQKGLRIPVVLATLDDDVEAHHVGAAVKLSKPYTLEQLLDALAVALGRDANHAPAGLRRQPRRK